MPKNALITGITGQDGSHLADFLLGKGYKIIGIKVTTNTNLTPIPKANKKPK